MTLSQRFQVWRSRDWLTMGLLLWLGCTSVFALTAPGRIDIIDGAIRFDVTRSLIDVGEPIVRRTDIFSVRGKDGKSYSFYPLGTSVLSIPFVLVGSALSDDSLETTRFAFTLTTVPFASGVVALFFMILGRLGVRLREAFCWSLLLAFATPLWVYAGSTFDQAIQAFWLLLGVWGAIEAYETRSMAWASASGIAWAILINIQEPYVIMLAGLFVCYPFKVSSFIERIKARTTIMVFVLASVGIFAVLVFNVARFGSPLSSGRSFAPHPFWGDPVVGLTGLIISPAKSIFLYCPLYFIALVGLRQLLLRRPGIGDVLAGVIAIHVVLTASLAFWGGDWAWGPRYLVATLPLAFIGAPFATRFTLDAVVTRWAAVVGVIVQLLALSVDHHRYYYEHGHTSFFWLNPRAMYLSSALLSRPSELYRLVMTDNRSVYVAIVPGPEPKSMTASIYGPDLRIQKPDRRWVSQYLVFKVPRPWTLWSLWIPPEYRPANGSVLIPILVAGVLVPFGVASLRLRREGSAESSSVDTQNRPLMDT